MIATLRTECYSDSSLSSSASGGASPTGVTPFFFRDEFFDPDAQFDAHHFHEEVADAAVGEVAGPFEVRNQADRSGGEQLAAAYPLGQRGHSDSTGRDIAIPTYSVLDDLQATVGPLDLLDHPPCFFVGVIFGNRLQAVFIVGRIRPAPIDFIGLEELAFVLGVARLTAGLELLIRSTTTGTILVRLGDIARRRLRRRRRITLHLGDPEFQCFNLRQQRSVRRRDDYLDLGLGIQLGTGVLAHLKKVHPSRRQRKPVNSYISDFPRILIQNGFFDSI
ncbi:MAG: hypothetical protein AAFX76_13045 [Planctomycetota bacterium]